MATSDEFHARSDCPNGRGGGAEPARRGGDDGGGTPADGGRREAGRGLRGRDGLILTRADHERWLASRAGCAECLPDVDVLCGGSPCQDWSVAGRRAGLAGQRTGLFFEFARLARELAPRWLLFENVPGLLSACSCRDCRPADGEDEDDEAAVASHTRRDHRGADFATVLEELSGLRPTVPADGWGNTGVGRGPHGAVVWRVLDAQWFGVPQRRRRVFVVVHRGSPASRVAEVLFDAAGLSGDPPPSRTAGAGVAHSVTSSTGWAKRQRAAVQLRRRGQPPPERAR